MQQAGVDVTFHSRLTYTGTEAGKNEYFANLAQGMLHNRMKLNMNHRELK
jgi:hypothetical protein